jgi:hypothetical protein
VRFAEAVSEASTQLLRSAEAVPEPPFCLCVMEQTLSAPGLYRTSEPGLAVSSLDESFVSLGRSQDSLGHRVQIPDDAERREHSK